jgi:hypothetical protein
MIIISLKIQDKILQEGQILDKRIYLFDQYKILILNKPKFHLVECRVQHIFVSKIHHQLNSKVSILRKEIL